MDPTLDTTPRGQAGERAYRELKRRLLMGEFPLRIRLGEERIVNERIRTVRMHDFLTGERIDRTINQHLGIVEAVLAGDLNTGEHRFTTHLGESIAVVEERAARAVARMVSPSI